MRSALFAILVLAGAASAASFAAGAVQLLRVIQAGQPDPSRQNQRGQRFRTLLREVGTQVKIRQQPGVGIAHALVLLAFIGLAITIPTALGEVADPGYGLPLIGHTTGYLIFTSVLALAALLGILHLVDLRIAAHRRGRASRFYGSDNRAGYFVEVVIAIIAIAVLSLNYLTTRYQSHPSETLANAITTVAAIKLITTYMWLAVVGLRKNMGVAWHRFTAFFNVYYQRHSDGAPSLGPLQPMQSGGVPLNFDDLADDARIGTATVDDLSWKARLDLVSCTECGRCQTVCPAWNTDKPLSPKLLINQLRDELLDPSQRNLVATDGVITDDELWSCTTCGACVQTCPVGIEHVDHIVDIRRNQVMMESRFPSEFSGLFKNLETSSNPWGQNPNDRLAWTRDLDFEIRTYTSGPIPADIEYLFWVGCAGAYEERGRATTRAVARLLHTAGIQFMVLGNKEQCTGDPARRSGNELLFQMQAQANVELLNNAGVKRILTTCPHCLNSLGREYPQLNGHYEVVHHTELLALLIREGRLRIPTATEAEKITFHDPCYLGRHNQIFSAPREILTALGADLIEMPRNRERSFCCGAGGGRMWTEESLGTRINSTRATEAADTGASVLAVGCPFCNVMLDDAASSQTVTDVAVLLANRLA